MMLTFSLDNIHHRLLRMPMAVMTLWLIVGIVIAMVVDISTALWGVLLSLFLVATIYSRRALFLAVVALGGMVYTVNSYQLLPHQEPLRLTLRVADDGIDYGNFATYSADVVQCNGERIRAKVRATAEERLQCGDIVVVNGKIRPFTPAESSYARAMRRQGYSGRVTVSERSVESIRYAERQSLHHRAVERLQSLVPQSAGRDVVVSLSLGAKSLKSAELKQSYSYSGVSHLLAVSGLHVGMVALLFNLLLAPLSLLWRGNMARSAAVVILIWFYVLLCGSPTSAIRAAIMFSVLQLSHLFRSRYSPENSLCTAAFVMLVIEPTMLFEVSFALSFIAVMAIVFVGQPLTEMLYCKNFTLRTVVSSVTISTLCVVATAPLISYAFGVVSLLSIVVTPLALVTAQIAIISSLLALVLPHSAAVVVMRAAEWCGTVQNSLVEWSVSSGIGFAEYRLDGTSLVVIYAVMVLLVLLSFGFKWQQRQRAKDILE